MSFIKTRKGYSRGNLTFRKITRRLIQLGSGITENKQVGKYWSNFEWIAWYFSTVISSKEEEEKKKRNEQITFAPKASRYLYLINFPSPKASEQEISQFHPHSTPDTSNYRVLLSSHLRGWGVSFLHQRYTSPINGINNEKSRGDDPTRERREETIKFLALRDEARSFVGVYESNYRGKRSRN